MKYFLAIYALAVAATVSILGFRGEDSRKPPLEIFPDMDRQAKILEQSGNAVFADGSSDRMPPAHSVPRGSGLDLNAAFSPNSDVRDHLADKVFNTGLEDGVVGLSGFPDQLEVNEELMREGKSQYTIYCSRCHGDLGNGKGVLSKFGLKPRNLTDPLEADYLKLPDLPDGKKHGIEGYVVHVIAEGKNTMLGMKDRVGAKQRWAIALYLKALRKWVESRDKPAAEPVVLESSDSASEDPALIAQGKALFQAKVCFTCHQVDPAVPAPAGGPLKAPKFIGEFWGTSREVHVGINGPIQKVNMDEAYFLESVENPMAKIVKGSVAGMAPLPTTLEERQALMAYVKSLSLAQGDSQESTTEGEQE